MVVVDTTGGQVCYSLHVVNVPNPTAAHIHEGAVGVAGPVVVPLDPPSTNGTASGCARPSDPGLLNRLQQNPAGFYVNVHNADFPDGAARGQLGR
jgi:hypothetical protein